MTVRRDFHHLQIPCSRSGQRKRRGERSRVERGRSHLDAQTVFDTPAVAVIDALRCPAMLLDERGCVVHRNALEMRANPLERETPGRTLSDLYPDYCAALIGDPPWLTEQSRTVLRVSADGEQRLEELHLCRLPHGACLLVFDQTHLRALEAQSAQTVRLASMGFMLASATHEINNPLTAIYSMVQILQSKKGVSIQALRQGLQTIAVSVRRLLAITRKLNAFSRVDAETATCFGIDDALEDAILLLSHDSLGETVEVSHKRAPSLVVSGLAGQLQQVFFNILLNAAQAMRGQGTVCISSEQVDDDWVQITIRDTGPGLPAGLSQEIFKPFFTTKASGEGTGLGLAICTEIVLEHGGTIWVESPSGGGACFHVRLPFAR
jgi:two-component system, NtrC family, sensor kinase